MQLSLSWSAHDDFRGQCYKHRLVREKDTLGNNLVLKESLEIILSNVRLAKLDNNPFFKKESEIF